MEPDGHLSERQLHGKSEKTEREEDAAINFTLQEFLLKELDMGI